MNAQSNAPTEPADTTEYARHYATHCRYCGTRLKAGVCPVCAENEVEKEDSHE